VVLQQKIPWVGQPFLIDKGQIIIECHEWQTGMFVTPFLHDWGGSIIPDWHCQ
jgi:hypothetical protein